MANPRNYTITMKGNISPDAANFEIKYPDFTTLQTYFQPYYVSHEVPVQISDVVIKFAGKWIGKGARLDLSNDTITTTGENTTTLTINTQANSASSMGWAITSWAVFAILIFSFLL